MRVKESLEALARLAGRRPFPTVGVVLALAIAGALLATGLKPSAATNTFVSASSSSYQATQRDYRNFGGDAVVILVREPLTALVGGATASTDLGPLSELEACFAGKILKPDNTLHALVPVVPTGTQTPFGGNGSPCDQLMRAHAVQVVYGPATFLNTAVAAVNTGIGQILGSVQAQGQAAGQQAYDNAIAAHASQAQASQAGAAAAQSYQQSQASQLYGQAAQYGITSPPSIQNGSFLSQIVFDNSRGVNQPKAKFAYLFPTANAALIQVRLKSSLSTMQQARVISLIRRVVKMPMFQLHSGGGYLVSGQPVVVSDLTSQITHSILILLIAAVLVMAVTLMIVFRRRLRLLPLAIALAAVGITFGIVAIAGATLTIASIAVLPILIGLAVDYAIQFQSRAQEARAGAGPRVEGARRAVARAGATGAPTIATAALATGTGFLVLLLSPVPMVRGFGLLLVLGVAIALPCALAAGSAVLVLSERDGGALGASLRGAAEILHASLRGAREIVGAGRRKPLAPPVNGAASGGFGNSPGRILGAMVRRPGRVLALGALLALLGWVADTQTAVQSDITKLVPKSMPALRDLSTLEHVTGTSGELDVTVHANDVATPAVIDWMISYQSRLLKHYGFVETQGCARSTLCPAFSLPDLFSTGSTASSGSALSGGDITSLLASVPAYFKQAVITQDDRDATLAFGIRLMPLARQEQVLSYMRSALHPPAGVTAQLAGLPVLAAEANSALSSSGRRLLTLIAGLVAVGLVLLAVLRRPRRALVPLVPIALATGWSALILYLIGIPLNPMSATLGALVIAVSTEFSVLLAERFVQERAAAAGLADALARTYRSTGAAVLASGVTAIVGFGVLMFSNITMLRDFGFVTVIDLTVSLLGVLLVLPAVLVVSERDAVGRRWPAMPDRVRSVRPRLRRHAPVA